MLSVVLLVSCMGRSYKAFAIQSIDKNVRTITVIVFLIKFKAQVLGARFAHTPA